MKRKFTLVILSIVLAGNVYSQVNCDTIVPPPSFSNYILPYPVGKTYCITQGNCSNFGHANLFAYDFNTQFGDTITACRPGQVIFVNEQYSDSDWVNGHENNVFIRHSDGTVIRYTHLKQFGVFVETGNVVTAGQPLALSGISGNTAGFPHLHLQAFRDGTSYDGYNTIPLNFSNALGPLNTQNLCILDGCYLALDPVSIQNNGSELPGSYMLNQNFPNPFNPSTIIGFFIPRSSDVKLTIYSISGEKIEEPVSSKLNAGHHEFVFNGEGLSTGVYIYRLEADGFIEAKKMMLIK